MRDSQKEAVSARAATEAWKEYYKASRRAEVDLASGCLQKRRLMQYQRVMLEHVGGEIERALQRKGRVRVWSAGSGIDLISLILKTNYGDKVEITISDASEECIAANRQLFAQAGLAAEIVVGDIFESGYSDVFDVVMNTGLLEHFERKDQERILSVISKSLVKGGSFVTLTPYSGARLYTRSIKKAQSRGTLSWPETPISTLKDLDCAGLTLVEEYPVCAIDQLATIGFGYPWLGFVLGKVGRLASRCESVAEPVLMKLIGGYCLLDRFQKA